MLIGWLPYLVIFFPGSVPYDGMRQLNMFYGVQPLTNHHPIFVTWVYGILYKIGSFIGNGAGVFIIILFNVIVCSTSYSYICNKIYKKSNGIIYSTLVALFFAIMPMWGSYVQAIIKDTLYFPVFALWIMLVFEVNDSAKSPKVANTVFFCVLSVLLSLIRNNGIYIAIPSLLMLLVFKKHRVHFGITLLTLLLLAFSFNNIIVPLSGAEPSPTREKLSLVFQQTARYVKYHGDELSQKEIDIIDKVLQYDTLASRYRPTFADPVKNGMPEDVTSDELNDFFKLWLSLYAKHPMTLIQATINNSYGYFYPFYFNDDLLSYQFYIESHNPPNTGYFGFHYVNERDAREEMIAYSELVQVSPGISLLESPGFYTWILIYMFYYLLQKRDYKGSFMLLIPALNIAICILSPVNGYL